MGSLTIRRLDDETKARLRLSAAAKGISMEEEARRRLKESLLQAAPSPAKLNVKDLLQFSVKPRVPFDQKKAADDLWDECLK